MNKFRWIFNRYIVRFFGNNVFPGSKKYWETRYLDGGNSGCGSYGKLACFKAQVINEFINFYKIKSVIDFGCGDGNQISLLKLPKYIGLDVSKTAIVLCQSKMKDDKNKKFFLYNQKKFKKSLFKSELGISLDVIYHLVEDDVFFKYMNDLFDSSTKYVIIYASNRNLKQSFHVKQRKFATWIKNNKPEWKFVKKISNKYPRLSIADFYIFKKIKK